MSKTHEMFERMNEDWNEFVENHAKAEEGNKAAGKRARKAIQSLKNRVTDYKKASVAGE